MTTSLSEQNKQFLFVKLTTAINNCLKKAISKLLEQGAPIINPLVPEDYTAVHYAAAACCPKEIMPLLVKKVTDLRQLYQHPKGPPWELNPHCKNKKAIYSFFRSLNKTTTATTTTTKATTIKAIRSSLYTAIPTTDDRIVSFAMASQPLSVRIGVSAAIGISSGLVHAFFDILKEQYPNSKKKQWACTTSQIVISSLLNVALILPFSHPTRLGVDTDLNSALVYGGMTLGLETLITGMDSFAAKYAKKTLQNFLNFFVFFIPFCLCFFLSADEGDKDTFSVQCFDLLAILSGSFFTYGGTHWIARCYFAGQVNSSTGDPEISRSPLVSGSGVASGPLNSPSDDHSASWENDLDNSTQDIPNGTSIYQNVPSFR
ncbi:MAG: hypothetical protein V4700_01285 [Pseudomonadota bacterium]